MSHTIKCRLRTLTEMQEQRLSINWYKPYHLQTLDRSLWMLLCVVHVEALGCDASNQAKDKPTISHPNVLINSDAPAK